VTLVRIDDSGQELTPAFLRRRGLRTAVAAQVVLVSGGHGGAELARRAIADLVEAFLHDRIGNADLFARAHRLGALLSTTAKCFWSPGPESYTLSCPIYALHQTWATSIAMTVTTRCSICGAGELECDHLAGDEYDGNECQRVVESIGPLGHVALTANPDFTYTWYRDQQAPTSALIADGVIRSVGDPATCSHCTGCPGFHGPGPGDLDPVGRWEQAVTEARDAAATE
jgi:hypothetical protein